MRHGAIVWYKPRPSDRESGEGRPPSERSSGRISCRIVPVCSWLPSWSSSRRVRSRSYGGLPGSSPMDLSGSGFRGPLVPFPPQAPAPRTPSGTTTGRQFSYHALEISATRSISLPHHSGMAAQCLSGPAGLLVSPHLPHGQRHLGQALLLICAAPGMGVWGV